MSIELNALAGTGSLTGTTQLPCVDSGASPPDTGTRHTVAAVFAAGFIGQSSVGTSISIAGTDSLALDHGGSLYLATVDQIFDIGFTSQGTLGSTSLLGTDTMVVDHGGTLYRAPLTAIQAALTGINVVDGTTTLTGVGILTLSTGFTLTGGSGNATLTTSGGGGSSLSISAGGTTVSDVTDLNITGSGITISGVGDDTVLSFSGSGGSIELTDGTNTVSSASTIVVDGGSVSGTGSSGTITVEGSFGGGPVFGTTTTLSSPAPSNFNAGTIANSTIGTLTLQQATGCPLQAILPLQGNANGLACQWQTSNSNSATVITLVEATSFFLNNNPQAFAAAIVAIGSSGIYAVGFSGSSGLPEAQLRFYTSNGQTLTSIPISVPCATRTGWFRAQLSGSGANLNFAFSPNNVNGNWVGMGEAVSTNYGTITGMGVGCDGYQYYATWNGSAVGVHIELDIWKWTYSSP